MSIHWDNNIGKRLFKSVTLSVGETNMPKPAGFYCTCGHYQSNPSTMRICPNKIIDYDKLLIIAREQFDVNFANYSELYDYLKQSYMTENDLEDQSFRVLCNKIMMYKPAHTIDTSVILDHVDGMKIYDDITYENKSISKDPKYPK